MPSLLSVIGKNPPVAIAFAVTEIDPKDHTLLLSSANLTLLTSVVSCSGIRSVKQHLRAPLKILRRGSANMHTLKTRNGQAVSWKGTT
jgi:hypothetical protein